MKLTKTILQSLIQEAMTELASGEPEGSKLEMPGGEPGAEEDESLESGYEGEAEFNPRTLLFSYFIHEMHGGAKKQQLFNIIRMSHKEAMERLSYYWTRPGFKKNTKDLIGRIAFRKLADVLGHGSEDDYEEEYTAVLGGPHDIGGEAEED